MSRKEVKLYEFRGELLTATQIRDKYKIPDRLVWKAFNDDSKPTLEQMIDWRESNGITDINDYRCGSMKRCKKKRGIEIYPSFTRQAQPEKTQTIKEGSRYGVYTVIGRSRKHKVNHINVFCTKCFKTHYDLPLSTFLNACDDKKCSCDKLGIYHIIRHYPSKIKKLCVNEKEKDINYYKEFVGMKLCGVRITDVTKKVTNDQDVYIFGCICPHCNIHFSVSAFDLITGAFCHKCAQRKAKSRSRFLNSGRYSKKYNSIYNYRSCHVNRDMSEDMRQLIQSHISFYTLNAGTQDFMNMCIDLDLMGYHMMRDQLYGQYM